MERTSMDKTSEKALVFHPDSFCGMATFLKSSRIGLSFSGKPVALLVTT